ncbi:MAG: AsmA family protein [Alphaproteobacteria bacterium]
MKKFLLVSFLLLLSVVGGFAAWFSYSFNAESYRERIIQSLSQMTGRTVEINGPVLLTWRPFPTLVISNLTLANQENSKTPLMFSAEQIRAEIEWGSLLKEPLVIKKVVLEKPLLLLERLRRYQTNFDFPILFKTTQNIDPSFLNGQNDFSLSIDEIQINNGTFTYENLVSGEKRVFNGVTGTGTMSSLQGPFSFFGTFLMADKPKQAEIHIGKIELAQSLPISLNLKDPSSETTIECSGAVFQNTEKPDEWLNLSGVIGSKNIGLFFQNIGIEKWPEGSLRGSFTFKVMTNKSVFESITARQGEGDSETSLFLGEQLDEELQKKVPTFVIKNMNYEEWKPLLSDFPKTNYFDKLASDFRIQLEEVKINNQLLTQGIAQGRIENGQISFSNLTLQLPYDSSLGLVGSWAPKEEKWDADIQLQSADLRSFLGWILNKTPDFLPENKIKNAQLNGHLTADKNQILSNVKVGILDESEFSGQIDIVLKEQTGIKTTLEVNNLNLDDYFKWSLQDLKRDVLPAADFDFNLKMQNFTLDNHLFQSADISGTFKDKVLSLTEFSGKGSDNSSLKISAHLQNLGTDNLLIQDLKSTFEIPHLSQFKLLKQNPFLNGDFEATGNIAYTGSLEKGSLQSDVIFNQASLKINGNVENLFDKMKFSEALFSLEHSDIQNFLIPFEKAGRFFPYLSGKFQLSFKGNGLLEALFAKDLSLSFEKQSLKGEVNWNLNEKTIQANLASSDFNLNLLLPSLEQIQKMDLEPAIPPEWQIDLALSLDKISYDTQKYTAFKTKMNLNNQVLTIPSLTMMTSDKKGHLSLTGKAILKSPMIIEGRLNLDKIPVENIYQGENFSLESGLLNLSNDFIASGNSWADLMNNLRANGNLLWQNGIMRGIDMNELASAAQKSLQHYQSGNTDLIKHALANGSTNVTEAGGSFQIEQGEIKLPEIKASANAGEIFMRKVNASFLTQKVNATLALVLKGLNDFPSLDVQLQEGQLIPQTQAFEEALEQENKILEKQRQENKEKEAQQKAEAQRNEIVSSAEEILKVSEAQIKKMKDTAALHPSAEAEELLLRATETSQEVRLLAVRPDLNPEQLTVLQEKANLLNVQSQELGNFLERQDVLRQREAVQKLPPLVKNRVAELIQIYNQNSQSALVAGLVQGSQKEEEKIKENLALLTKAQELDTAQKLIDEVKESFQKIQKALNYARQLDLAGGTFPPSAEGE